MIRRIRSLARKRSHARRFKLVPEVPGERSPYKVLGDDSKKDVRPAGTVEMLLSNLPLKQVPQRLLSSNSPRVSAKFSSELQGNAANGRIE
jgi:hypothetical protein